jgi:hypothetical protein
MTPLEFAAALLKTTDVYTQRLLDKAKAHDIDPYDLLEYLQSLNEGAWSINYFSIIQEMHRLLLNRAERVINPDWEDGDDRSLAIGVHYHLLYKDGDLILDLNTNTIFSNYGRELGSQIIDTLNWYK